MAINDHPLRYMLANELHARPFPSITAPARAAYLALKAVENAAARDRQADRDHLIRLLDRFGAPHPQPDATHYSGAIGKHFLKWEMHTEFVTYTIFGRGVAERPYDGRTFEVFPPDWLSEAPGVRITSSLIRIETAADDAAIARKADDWFLPESLAISRVLGGELVIAGDFRIDTSGHVRFAVFPSETCGERRIGRVVQRLTEIETYKAMSMLGLARARDLGPTFGKIDGRLSDLVTNMAGADRAPAEVLDDLLAISADLESVIMKSSFRFGATGAYETIVNQRIDVLREERFDGRQTFFEFMTRRYDPAMRTVKSTERRLAQMSDRAARAADLLRTRVDVERSAQNQALLASMDRRADTQLRLQRTVEGLSVVAISYYAVSLAMYLLGPAEAALGIGETTMAALATPVVVLLVWLMVWRVRRNLQH